MTTLERMREKILMRKMVSFAKHMACKRKGMDRKFNLYFEYLSPRNTVGRCYPCRDRDTHRHNGHDIIISIYWIRRFSTDINGFKAILLHELAHTNRHVVGHGLEFRRACRRLNVMTYYKMSDRNL